MTFFPLGDNNPRVLVPRPWVTWGIAVACSLVFVWETMVNPHGFDDQVLVFAIVPGYVSGFFEVPGVQTVPPWLTLGTSLFLHVDLVHLAVNMLYLVVFADNIEDDMGHVRFLVFYLACGLAAGLTHVWVDPTSLAPTLGASGAVSGILGGYLLLHPRAKVWFFPSPFAMPAWFWLIVWAGFQFYAAYSTGWSGSGIAWGAHIGGFLVGLVLVVPMRRKTVPLFGPAEVPSGVTLANRSRDDKGDE